MRQESPSRVLKADAWTHGVQLHEAERRPFRQARGELERGVELILSRRDGAVECLRPDADVVEMRFEGKLKGLECFVFVNMNFERVLRCDNPREEKQSGDRALQAYTFSGTTKPLR